MNIGIDVDDTISNSLESVFADSQKFDIEELRNNGEVKQYGKIYNHNYIETMYSHWTKEQISLFWKKYFINMLTIATPKPFVAETIQKLKKEGHKITIITSRYEVIKGKKIIELYTKKWLAKNKIKYDEFIMDAQDKLIAAQKANVDILIDDSVYHCKKMQEGNLKALLFTTICNQGLEVPELERVYSWPQIYQKITKLNSYQKDTKK